MNTNDNIVNDAETLNGISGTSTTTTATWQTQYWDKRRKDIIIETTCANYVDSNWFNKFPDKLTYERVTDRARQLKGEDVVLSINSGKQYTIDEKAKVQGLIGKVIAYPCLEVLCKDKNGHNHFESWFATSSNTTTHYAMISIGSDKYFPKGDEWKIKDDDITCMVYGLIDVERLKHFVEKETGKTIKEITKDAWNMLADYEQRPYYYKYDPVRSYKKDAIGNYIHLKMSTQKKEQPINLMVRRDVLRNNKLITEVYIDRNKVCRYTPPNHFDKQGDILTAIEE